MVSPGLWGFLAFFVLAVALYLLMRNMNARMRRMSYRAEERARDESDRPVGPDDAADPVEPADDEGPQEQTGRRGTDADS